MEIVRYSKEVPAAETRIFAFSWLQSRELLWISHSDSARH